MAKLRFYPPKKSRLTVNLGKIALPFFMRSWMKVEKMHVDSEMLKRLDELKGKRVVLCPNHPTGLDPVVLFCLSKILNDEFYYLAAVEVFKPAIKGWLMQKLGCYSIVRGTHDFESFRMTRQLLAEGEKWLVLFPEGETCGQNDTVMPFQHGVAQFGFWGLEDLAKKGESPPLYLVPVAVKYFYLKDMSLEISSALTRLERKLSRKAACDANNDLSSSYERLRRIGEIVLSTAKKEYGIHFQKETSLNDQVQQVKEIIVSRVASMLGAHLSPEQPLIERIRNLFNSLDQILHEEAGGSEYEQEIHRKRQEEVRPLYRDLFRALNFIGTYDGYVRETLTCERFLEIIGRLEREVFGKELIPKGPREVHLKAGKPVNLAELLSSYRKDKLATLTKIMFQVEEEVKKLLAENAKN